MKTANRFVLLASAAIARAARSNPNITVAGLQDELKRGAIDGWMEIVQLYKLTFSQWSCAMEIAIDYLECDPVTPKESA